MTKNKIAIALCVATLVIFGAAIFVFWQPAIEAMPIYVESAPTPAPTPSPTPSPTPTPKPTPTPLPEPTHPSYSWIVPPIYDGLEVFQNGFARMKYDGVYGIVNVTTGEVAALPKFDSIGWFGVNQEFANARLQGRWGAIDAMGREIVPFEHERFDIYIMQGPEDANMATILVGDSVSLIDLDTGREVVPHGVYSSIFSIRDGIAIATIHDDAGDPRATRQGLIDVATGEEIVPLIYTQVRHFSDGLAAVRVVDEDALDGRGKWGFVNIAGEMVIPPIYYHVRSFYNGVAVVQRDGLKGIIDTNGNYIWPPTDIYIFSTDRNFFGLYKQDNYWGILEMQHGNKITLPMYSSGYLAGEGLFVMNRGDNQNPDKVLVNLKTGQEIAPFLFDRYHFSMTGMDPPWFRNGVAIVRALDAEGPHIWGLVDAMGREVLPFIYQSMAHFSDDLLVTSFGHKETGMVDITGRQILRPIYSYIETQWRQGNLAPINYEGVWLIISDDLERPEFQLRGGLWGFINEYGQIVVPPELDFVWVRSAGHNRAAVQMPNGLWGIIRIYGEETPLLGYNFVMDEMQGDRIRQYHRIIHGDRAYELISTNYRTEEYTNGGIYETWVFVSELKDGTHQYLDSFEVPLRAGRVVGGFVLLDIDFDGVKDVLVWQGPNEYHFGIQAADSYAAFLRRGDTYIEVTNFGVPNPWFDAESGKIISAIGFAAGSSYTMHTFVDNEFVTTDILWREPDTVTDGVELRYTVRMYNGQEASKIFLYPEDANQIETLFYADDSHWGLRNTDNNRWTAIWHLHTGGQDED